MKTATRFRSVAFHVTYPWAFTLLVAGPSPWKSVPELMLPSWELLLGTQHTQDTMLPGTEDASLHTNLFSFIHIRIPARNMVTRRGKQVWNGCNFPFLLKAWSQLWLLLEATSARGFLVMFHSVPTDRRAGSAVPTVETPCSFFSSNAPGMSASALSAQLYPLHNL